MLATLQHAIPIQVDLQLQHAQLGVVTHVTSAQQYSAIIKGKRLVCTTSAAALWNWVRGWSQRRLDSTHIGYAACCSLLALVGPGGESKEGGRGSSRSMSWLLLSGMVAASTFTLAIAELSDPHYLSVVGT